VIKPPAERAYDDIRARAFSRVDLDDVRGINSSQDHGPSRPDRNRG